MNNVTFIPILAFPVLMANNSHLLKPFSYTDIKVSGATELSEVIDENEGRAVTEVILKESAHSKKSIVCDALIDTGASFSIIKPHLIEKLGLKPFPGAEIAGLNLEPRKEENVDLSIHIFDAFPNNGFLDICPVVKDFGSKEDDIMFDFIIGWDVLRYCNLQYNGANKSFTLQFIPPSK